MSDILASVLSVRAIKPVKDDFLSFKINLIAQKQTTYASMAWRGAANEFLEAEYEFSNGVTIDPDTGLLVIPQDVSSFTISRRIAEEDSDDFILSPELDINDVSASNPESEVEIDPANAARVERLGAVRRVVPEGKSFSVYVDLAPGRAAAQFAVAFTGNTADAARRKDWRFSHGVRWNADRSKIIVPAGCKGFRIIIPAYSDNFNNERQEAIRLTIGSQSIGLTITNVPAGQVTSLTEIWPREIKFIANEGESFGMSVKVVKRSYVTSLAVAATGNTTDIVSRWQWRFTKGVTWNNDYSRLLVPAGVASFEVYIGTKIDNILESFESVNIRIGTKTFNQEIRDVRFKEVEFVNFVGTDPIEGHRSDSHFSKFALKIHFKKHTPWSTINYFKVNLGGAAFSHFNWSFESTTNGVYFNHLGKGLFRVINQLPRKNLYHQFIVNAYANANAIFAGNQVGWVSLPGSDGRFARRFTVRDSFFSEFQNTVPMFVKSGFVRSTKDFRNRLRSVRTSYNTPLLKEKLKNHTYFVTPEFSYIYNANKEQTIEQFLVRVAEHAKAVRTDKMNMARNDLLAAYADLTPPSFVGGVYKETVMENASIYLAQMRDNLTVSLNKAVNVRIQFATVIGSADPNDPQDRDWMGVDSAPAASSIRRMWDQYLERFDKFVDTVSVTFDQIRVLYSEVPSKRETFIMNVVSAALSGLAILGSIGFFVANFRAAWNQVSGAVAAGTTMNFSAFFQHSINAPAAFGSATLLANNAAATVINTLKSMATGTAGFQYFNGLMGEFVKNYDAENAKLFAKLKKFEDKYLDMLHYVLLNGGAGESDNWIRTDENVDPSDKSWQDRRGFIPVQGYALAWKMQPIPQRVGGLGGYVYKQEIWGIPEHLANGALNHKVTSPVVLDLVGDGLDFAPLSRTALFDADHDGKRDRIAWIADGTALLTFDVDEDGNIARTDEINFVGYKEGAKTDLEGLTAFDSNADNLLDGNDRLWHQFGIWQDKNQDGVTQKGELVSLDAAGIRSISLVSDKIASTVGDVLIYGRSHFTRVDGTVGTVGDVGFRYANA